MAANPTYTSHTSVSSTRVILGETTSITTTFTNTNNTAYYCRVAIQLFDGKTPSPVASSAALKTIPANGSTSFTFEYTPQTMDAAWKQYNIAVGLFAPNPQWDPNLYWEWTPLKITVIKDNISGDTADPDATAPTKATYAELLTAPSRLDHRLVIGQALRGWDFTRPVDQPVTALTDAGLPAPALLEVDLTDFGATQEHDSELYALLLRHANAGGLLGFSLHANNPFTGGDVYDRRNVDLPQLADPANPQTPAAVRWRSVLDRIADIMRSFPTAVVLFRPLHESNGNWFWWGQRDPAAFRALWQGMFSYLTLTKGLHNLLWVYSANRNLGDDLSDPTRLYPGAAVVDLVGLDIYDDDLADTEPGYEAMVALGKPFGITEYAATNWFTEHDGAVELPNDKVITIIKQDYAQAVLATCWYSSNGNNWQISDKPRPEALLLDPWAITLAQRRRVPQRGRPRPNLYPQSHEGHQGAMARPRPGYPQLEATLVGRRT